MGPYILIILPLLLSLLGLNSQWSRHEPGLACQPATRPHVLFEDSFTILLYKEIRYNMLHIEYHMPRTQYETPNPKLWLFPKNSLRIWAAMFERYSPFLELDFLGCFPSNLYTRMCVLTIGSFSLFGKIMETHGKHTSRILFFCVFSDFWFLYLLYYS